MKTVIAFVLVAVQLISPLALSHHGAVNSGTLYHAALVELEGEITDVLWRNPHPRLRLKVINESDEETSWELELNSSLMAYRRMGIAAGDIARVGDHVKIAGFISRRDAHSLGVLNLLLPNGEEFVNFARSTGGNVELRWSNVRMTTETQEIDPAEVETVRQVATGIFRVWGGYLEPFPQSSEYESSLTERGRELAAAYDAVRDNPELECRQGMPATMFDPTPLQIIDGGDRILIQAQEYDIQRTIHMSPGEPTADPQLSPLGYSAGSWDGDALVVTTSHVGWPYLDIFGTPQSDQVSHTERFEASRDGNTLNYSLTVVDPIMFSQPITIERTRVWEPGREIERYDCVAQWEDPEGENVNR